MNDINAAVCSLYNETLIKFGITQADIVRVGDISPRSVSQFCTGKLDNPKLSTFITLVEALPSEAKRYFIDRLSVVFSVMGVDSSLGWIHSMVNLALVEQGVAGSFMSDSIFALADYLLKLESRVAMHVCLKI